MLRLLIQNSETNKIDLTKWLAKGIKAFEGL